ncbi:hypothetical protein ACUNE1_11310 [Serratia sp. IR-2025]
MSKERSLSFDFLKGLLILLVIVGHLLPGSAQAALMSVCVGQYIISICRFF